MSGYFICRKWEIHAPGNSSVGTTDRGFINCFVLCKEIVSLRLAGVVGSGGGKMETNVFEQ